MAEDVHPHLVLHSLREEVVDSLPLLRVQVLPGFCRQDLILKNSFNTFTFRICSFTQDLIDGLAGSIQENNALLYLLLKEEEKTQSEISLQRMKLKQTWSNEKWERG